MNKIIRNVFASTVLSLIAAASASAGVIVSEHDVSYTASLSGNILNLTIDASANTFSNVAKELDILTFNMVGLDQVTLVSAPSTDWNYSLVNNKTGKDMASFTAAASNHTLLTAPLQFSFAFTGTDLDFAKLGLKATYLANSAQSDSITALNVSVADVGTDPAAVPEPASIALLLGGLGLLGAARRKNKRA